MEQGDGAGGGSKFDIKPQGYIVIPVPLRHAPIPSNGSSNLGKAYKNPRMDEILIQAATASGAERDALYREFQQIAEQDALIVRCFQARYVEAMHSAGRRLQRQHEASERPDRGVVRVSALVQTAPPRPVRP